MSTTINDIAKLLKSDDKKGDTSFWGIVHSTIEDGEGNVTGYNVSLDGSANGAVKCNKVVGAKQGDQVLVTLRANGEAVVVATKGGDTDALNAQDTADAVATDLDTNYYDKAETEALIATTASGSKIYYQTSAPTGGTYKTGDTWFDTDNGYKMYRWNGSAWAAALLDSDAFAAGSITTSELAAGAVTAAKLSVASLSAISADLGTITGGTLTLTTSTDTQAKVTVANTEGTRKVEILPMGLKTGTVTIRPIRVAETAGTTTLQPNHLKLAYSSGYYATLSADSSGNLTTEARFSAATIGTSTSSPVSTVYTNGLYLGTGETVSNKDIGQTSGGFVRPYSSSSRRFKNSIHEMTEERKEQIRGLYDLDVLEWKYNDDHIDKDDEWYDTMVFGVMAEDLAEIIPESKSLDEEGNIRNYKDRLLLNAMLVLIQEQHEEIEHLKSRVERLENK